MIKSLLNAVLLVSLLGVSACYDGSYAGPRCSDQDGGVVSAPMSTCDTSRYQWGEDDVLYVCQNPIPITSVSGAVGVALVADFQFANYRGLWINDLTRFCVRNVGPTNLENVGSITFLASANGWTNQPVTVMGPWPEDGKICADVDMNVGAESVSRLEIRIASTFPHTLVPGSQYQFEITSADDITNSGEPEPIVGDFPVRGAVVSIAPSTY